MKKSSMLVFAALVSVAAGLALTSRPSDGHSKPAPKLGLATPTAAPHKAEATPIELSPVVIMAEAPKAKHVKRHVCETLPLNVSHTHTTNTDTRIKGDGAVLVCSWK